MVCVETAMTDARRYHRVPVDLRATVIAPDAAPEACRIANLSVGGALVSMRALWQGTQLRLSFRLASLGEDVDATATVMWCEGETVGVRFDGLRAREVWALCEFLDAAPRSVTHL